MYMIGLTGGIGSGKSTVAALMRQRGFPVVDADQVARDNMEPGSPVLAAVAEEFGADLLGPDGTLDRAELARRAFASEEATQRLNAITHPAIRAESARRFAALEAAGERAAVYDMPLLVELGMDQDMDMTVVVDVNPEERVRRLVAHRGLDEADARNRIARQIPDVERRAAADVVLDNNGTEDKLAQQVDTLANRITNILLDV
ncbi:MULTISPECIES: dephospho-CoA kinase [Corynebacterium]|uniref:Dephospho-CoA kinase n=1 Tax=Corynebacterium hadale TaxID=2026255 RepID=A0A269PBA5_9CORY|nr:dephospho-CoA kinase [Corynebacterium hadale]PAJ68467.1 dephospho-CoA kinase [Corynebacterium hadale]WKC60027.1 Dephospho-CoA kinase [Corynebacterium hadale]